MVNNYWDPFEYNKLKLLLNREKVDSILAVLNGEKLYDDLFPISVDIHLTNACNLSCSWCTDKELMKRAASMSKEVALRLIDEFARYNTGVTLEGGESRLFIRILMRLLSTLIARRLRWD